MTADRFVESVKQVLDLADDRLIAKPFRLSTSSSLRPSSGTTRSATLRHDHYVAPGKLLMTPGRLLACVRQGVHRPFRQPFLLNRLCAILQAWLELNRAG
jgi:hypothetical protein